MNPKPLLITMGDAAGIGPEIIAKAFREAPAELAGCVVVGDVSALRRASAFHLVQTKRYPLDEFLQSGLFHVVPNRSRM